MKCDVAAGFSPSFAGVDAITKGIRWKAKAFRYMGCASSAHWGEIGPLEG